jgi:hypothetical protein
VFTGEDPQLWRSHCENYFGMYGVEQQLWVRVMSMHFEGPVARWLQSAERQLRHAGWDRLCALLHDRFGHDQHEALIRQLFHIKQSGSVAEYVEQFSKLVDQLVSYESKTNPLYYAMRFVDGLRDEIRQMVMIQRSSTLDSVVMIQRPSTLDSTCSLALVQEEAVESARKKEPRCYELFSNRQAHRLGTQGIHLPKLDKPASTSVADDRRSTKAAQASVPDDKVRVMRQWRRARGLCDKCAEKWVFGHKCSQTVQLNAVQEVFDLFSDDEGQSSGTLSPETNDAGQLCLCLSEAAVLGKEVAMPMKLMGRIQSTNIVILLDSGSSHTFISAKVAANLAGISGLPSSLSVKVANGARLSCTQQIQKAVWHIEGIPFTSDLKIIPLDHFDMVLGYDWLMQFSPMRVHWGSKWLVIPYAGSTVVLHGVLS